MSTFTASRNADFAVDFWKSVMVRVEGKTLKLDYLIRYPFILSVLGWKPCQLWSLFFNLLLLLLAHFWILNFDRSLEEQIFLVDTSQSGFLRWMRSDFLWCHLGRYCYEKKCLTSMLLGRLFHFTNRCVSKAFHHIGCPMIFPSSIDQKRVRKTANEKKLMRNEKPKTIFHLVFSLLTFGFLSPSPTMHWGCSVSLGNCFVYF